MSIKFNGINNEVVTFKATAPIKAGTPVRPSANETVIAAPSNSPFIGVVENYSNGLVGVRIRGYFELPFSSTAPTVGFAKLATDGNGGVKIDTTYGRECAIVFVDDAAKTVGFFM